MTVRTRTDRRDVSPQAGSIYILRIATVLLAIVSWWATAQGMAEYVFREKWQANLASLAVQSILLGLNFYLPSFLKKLGRKGKAGLLALTFVVLFCSSWFSYVYIVGRTYDLAWDTDSRLLVQSTYRTELYHGHEYAGAYRKLLREELGGQITTLYAAAQELEEDGASVFATLDLAQDRADYAENSEFAARKEMQLVIQAMEKATAENATESDREAAVKAVADQIAWIEEHLADLSKQIEQTETDLDNADTRLLNYQRRLNSAPAGSDTTELLSAYNQTSQQLSSLENTQKNQQTQETDYETALSRIQLYESHLDLSASGSDMQISSALREIQRGLLSTDSDMDQIEEQALLVFQQLQSARSGGNDSGDMTLLNEMDAFIQQLGDYSSLRKTESTLAELIEELREDASVENWKSEWTEKLEKLKAELGSLPDYAGGEKLLSGSFVKTESMDALDEMLRLYISDHNAVDQAIIYLGSPYWGLALFSLLLAFFLDIAAFITGVLIAVVDADESGSSEAGKIRRVGTGASAPATARRYPYLTGDFEHRDGRYFYQALDSGQELTLELPEGTWEAGLYRAEAEGIARLSRQEVALSKMPGGPRDGVYADCTLQYSDHMLTIRGAGEREFRFLAVVEPDTPVFRMTKDGCVIGVAQDIPPQQWSTVILALNSSGTVLSAVYLTGEN